MLVLMVLDIKGSTPYPIAIAFWCSGRIQQMGVGFENPLA
jgi:hypothetical protein